MTNEFNGINRGVYIADNLRFLRRINSECVDLVCIDPPFAKNDTFTGDKLKPPLDSSEKKNEMRLLKRWGIGTAKAADKADIAWPDDDEAKGGFRDTWSWDGDIHEDWVDGIKATHPVVNMLIETTRHIHSDSAAAYIAFMAIRLFEIHRILKPTGSLFLHCDHSANGYLRQLLDAVFGNGVNNSPGFRNEVVWSYRRWAGRARKFQQMHDTIFFYTKTDNWIWNWPMEPKAASTPKHKRWNVRDPETGRLTTLSDVSVDVSQTNMRDVWEMSWLQSNSKERTGYPTQKPVSLAERIIAASTNKNDVVLDCFAGCAYVPLAAEKLERRWVACDLNPRAWTMFKRQFNKGGGLPILACNDATTGQQVLGSAPTVTVYGPGQLPKRTDDGSGVQVKPLRTNNRRSATQKQYKRESTLMSREKMLAELLKLSQGKAWCCGYTSFDTAGQAILGNYELDHITPKNKGGEDEIINRAPLCGAHNRMKAARDINLHDLRVEIAFLGQLAKNIRPENLIDLEFALREARNIFEKAYLEKHGVPMI